MLDLALKSGPNARVRAGRRRAIPNDAVAYRCGVWLLAAVYNDAAAIKFCRENDIPLTRAQSEGTNTSGGAIVPNEMLAAIIALREVTGAYRAAADIRPMSSDTASVARRTAGLTAYFSAENTALTASQAAWDAVTLTAKKLATFSISSTELDDDAIIDLAEYTVTEAAYAFAVKEDDCGFNGDGTSTYGGIRGLGPIFLDGNHNAGRYVATGHTSYDVLTATDLANLIGIAPAMAYGRGAWFCSPLAFALVFCRLAAAAGGWIMMPDATGRLRPSYLGWPVLTSTALPNVNTSLSGKFLLAFGDLSLAATVGDRREVSLMRSEHRYFDTDQVAFRCTERVDIVNHDVGDNVTAGPIVGLVAG